MGLVMKKSFTRCVNIMGLAFFVLSLFITAVQANVISNAELRFDSETAASIPLNLAGLPTDFIRKAIDSVDTTGLSGPDHTAFIRFQDNEGNWSDFIQQRFYIPNSPSGQTNNAITTAELRFDSATATPVALLLDGSNTDSIRRAIQSIDISGLALGDHTAFIRFEDAQSAVSNDIQLRFFIPESSSTGEFITFVDAETFIDTEPGEGAGNDLPLTGQTTSPVVIAEGDVDVSSVEPGMHSMYIRLKDSSGNWSSPFRSSFFEPYGGAGNSGNNSITGADRRIDYGPWEPIPSPVDGAYDGLRETAQTEFVTVPGYHRGQIRFLDAAGAENSPLPADLAYDSDQDGLPDSWELAQFGHLNYDGEDDPDGDGKNNFTEFYEGTDPGNYEGGEIPVISGHVFKDGNGLAGIRVCITGLGMYRCDAVTAADGSYILNNGNPLPDHDWQVFPELDQEYIFTPHKRSVTTSGSRVENVDFIATDFPVPAPYYTGKELLGDPSRNGIATPVVGFGVNSVTGNFFYSELDAALPGKEIPFVFTRYYNSQENGKNSFGDDIYEPMNRGWSHNYNIQLFTHQTDPLMEVKWGDGRRDGFTASIDGWVAFTPGNFAKLTQLDASTWQVQTKDRLRYLFDSTGRLTAIKRAYENGAGDHVMQFTYTGDDLTTITDTAGRTIDLLYDASHRLTRMDLPGPTSDCAGTGKRSIQYGYAADGRLNSVVDMNCNEQRYVYSASTMNILWKNTAWDATPRLKVTFDEGLVSRQETGWNLTTGNGVYLFTWGTDNLTYQTPTGVGNAVFNRDDKKRVTSIVRGGKTQTIGYAVNEGPDSILPNSLTDFEGHEYSATFTNSDLTAVGLPDGRSQLMSFTDHTLTAMTSESGLQTNVGINSKGKPTSIGISGTGIPAAHQPSYTLSYSSGDLLNLVTSATANGKKTAIASTAADGQPLELRHYTDASNYLSTIYTYDDAGRKTSIKDHRGTLTCFYYDDEDNLVDKVAGLVDATCPTTPPAASSTVRHTHYEYDQENRATLVVEGYGSPEAFQTSYTYNATTGKLARTCAPLDHCSEYRYTSDGKVKWVIRPGDNRKDQFYELASGRVRITRENADKITSAFDRIVRYEYDGNGDLITESSCVNMAEPSEPTSDCTADSVRKHILRDNLGRPEQIELYRDVTADDKRVTKYIYSPDGLTTTVSVIGRDEETIYTRNSAGQLISVEEKNGSQSFIASYEYDGDGRLIKIIDPDSLETTFSYDGLGRKLSKTDLSGTTTWSYNDAAGTVHISKSDGSFIDVATNRLGQVITMTTSDGNTFSYTYDTLGRLDVESWSGTGGSGSRDYDYTDYNRIDKITGPFGKVVDYTYDTTHRLTQTSFDTHQLSYIYNGLDEIDKMYTPAGTFEFSMDDYTGALQQITYPPASGLQATYQRNDLGELTGLTTQKGATVITDYQITLDDLGRRQTIASEQPMAPAFGTETLNLLLKTSGVNKGLIDTINGAAPGYDGRGNITSLPAPYDTTFSYDVLDRVTGVGTTQHKYDAGRNRLETIRNDQTTRYLLNMAGSLPDVLATMDESNKIQNVYVNGPGGLLAEVKQDGTTRFVVQDFNSNVVALTDGTGSVVSSYAYTPFGKSAGISGDIYFPFRFAGGVGAMTDPEDVVYMRARYYHPGIQQFTSADLVPGDLGRPQSLGRYAYIEGMGLGGVDPSGLMTEASSFDFTFIAGGFRTSWSIGFASDKNDYGLFFTADTGLAAGTGGGGSFSQQHTNCDTIDNLNGSTDNSGVSASALGLNAGIEVNSMDNCEGVTATVGADSLPNVEVHQSKSYTKVVPLPRPVTNIIKTPEKIALWFKKDALARDQMFLLQRIHDNLLQKGYSETEALGILKDTDLGEEFLK